MRKRTVLTVAAAGALTLAAGCGSTAGEEDAAVGKRHEADRPVWVMSDGYPNISAVCIGVNGVYVQRSDPAPPQVVKDDPNCAEGGALAGDGR